ncbi:MAG: hypothetical protein WCG25_07565 [bacterium]
MNRKCLIFHCGCIIICRGQEILSINVHKKFLFAFNVTLIFTKSQSSNISQLISSYVLYAWIGSSHDKNHNGIKTRFSHVSVSYTGVIHIGSETYLR